MVCNAFLDVMRESPAIYGAIAEAGFEPGVREYAGAMLAAWTRSHLRKDVNAHVKRALSGEYGGSELVNATRLAWAERERAEREWVKRGRPRLEHPAPLRHGMRFRDSLPPKREGGRRRRRRAHAPPDLVNLTSATLEYVERGVGGLPEEFLDAVGEADNKIETAPENAVEIQLARFSERELEEIRRTALEMGRQAGLPPREMQLVDTLVSNPGITNREAGELLSIKLGTVKSMRSRIKAAGVAV